MKRNWTGKLQETLLLVYISWKKVRAHTFKDTLEEVIRLVIRSEKMKEKYMKIIFSKSFLVTYSLAFRNLTMS